MIALAALAAWLFICLPLLYSPAWPPFDWLASLSVAANIAQTLTGIFAALAFFGYLQQKLQRRWKIERYLEDERRSAENGGLGMGAKSIIHLMGNCSMTEAQVLEAVLGSTKIRSWVAADDEGRAERLFFQFSDDAWRKVRNQPSRRITRR
ncbi:hypothetical protein KMZ68_12655 [Bradyrhizobium sediminis]|uniref:Uncharacterized protein n=1 Tax=Bradyrhizobium sediminis TaxID=2840469 RepID=A0A975NSL9_9BRAD|nr:hypothetical protein [Bradyrhizobium sediminis]QWG20612.1 hypothetical protein KMZ68_12655 [Bradyrhizobium sediminis]